MERKQEIMFVDDEVYWSGPYIRELEKSFKVHVCKNAGMALERIRKMADLDAVIVDVMMPTPSGVSESETQGGLITGIWLLETLRREIIERRMPVLILTNRSLSAVEAAVADLAIPNGLVEVRSKMDTPKFYLTHVVQEMLARLPKNQS